MSDLRMRSQFLIILALASQAGRKINFNKWYWGFWRKLR